MHPRWSGLTAGLLLSGGALVTAQTPEYFDWDSIDPSPELRYHDCYADQQCARLEVPLNWLDPNNTNTVAIAIVKQPATVPDSDPSFGGSVLMNPGGPGGSGVEIALAWGERLQGILAGKKNYEVIGFDPRGVGSTTPRADCYADELARTYERLQDHGSGALSAHNSKLGSRHALSLAYGQRCANKMGGEGGILEYASTASVARDMVAIIDRIEDLRDEEKAGQDGAEMAGEKKQPARLQYLGFSYGTLLGNTFASMFPGRVGRMVLDGVVDADDYMAGTWLKNLQDADAAIDYLYQVCFNLGSACPVYDGTEAEWQANGTDNSWQELKARVEAAIAPLAHAPIPLETAGSWLPLSDVDVNALLLMALYKPDALYPFIFSFLGALLRGDRLSLAAIIDEVIPIPALKGMCDGCVDPSCPPAISSDAQGLIACSDGEPSGSLSPSDWRDYFGQLANQSSAVGPTWAEIRFRCAGWPSTPNESYRGPFETPEHDVRVVDGKPAAPLLFLSTRIDPVTPLRNAYAMAARHPGSAVVVQDSVGHAALGTAVSSCTEKIVRAYFEDGTVPEGGRAACEEDCGEGLRICARDERESAPIPWINVGGLSQFGNVDLGRMAGY